MSEPKIIVAVRKRPLSKKQQKKGDSDIITIKNRQTVILTEYKQKVDLTKYLEETVFNFDYAYDQMTTNEEIYDSAVRPLIDSAFQGAKVTCFAYGQTGSGKTYTMNGSEKLGVLGLYALGANDIFGYIADPKFQHLSIRLSYYEIYCGKLYDLLNKRQELKIRQDNKSNINIIGVEEIEVCSWHEFLDYLNVGASQRITSQNSANAQSSRSHGILQIVLKDGKKTFGKISFIDLAGNQRGADHTDQKKQTRIDGAEINKSLLALKQCIRALDQGKTHTPFRGSKLTMVLKDSFVGFCRTVMIGNVSPSSTSSENTLNTLRYADRVKQLKKPNEGLTKEQIKARQMMLPRNTRNAIKIEIEKDDDDEDIEMKRKKAQENFGIRNQEPQMKLDNSRNRVVSSKQNTRSSSKLNNLGRTQNIREIKYPSTSNNATRLNMGNQKRSYMTGSTGLNQRRNSEFVGNSKNLSNSQRLMDIQQPVSRHSNNYVNNMYGSQKFTKPQPPKMDNYSSVQRTQNINQNIHPNMGSSNNFNNLIQRLQHPQNPNNSQNFNNVYKNLLGLLFNEEKTLMGEHSNTLGNQLKLLRTEMSMIQEIESGVQKHTTREYLNSLQESIDEKMSLLEMLRQKMLEFRYKFDAVEQLEKQNSKEQMEIEECENLMGDDEQLLDDLH